MLNTDIKVKKVSFLFLKEYWKHSKYGRFNKINDYFYASMF